MNEIVSRDGISMALSLLHTLHRPQDRKCTLLQTSLEHSLEVQALLTLSTLMVTV